VRGSITLHALAAHPRMIAVVAATTVAGCLALVMAFVVGLVGPNTASGIAWTVATTETYDIRQLNPREILLEQTPAFGVKREPQPKGGKARNEHGKIKED
jgi:hypothetical protein